VHLKYGVAGFFALSFLFQFAVEAMSWSMFGGRGYTTIFVSDAPDDTTFEIAKKNKDETQDNWQVVEGWCSQLLAFNELRFIEYSFSGSLVLACIATVAGISDVELLACIYLLGFACMILGLVAEYTMRAYNVLQILQDENSEENSTKSKALDHLFNVMKKQLRWAFRISHILAWLCIILPWIIIYLHYQGWWNQCKETAPLLAMASSSPATPPKTTTTTAAALTTTTTTPPPPSSSSSSSSSQEPPDFVKAIVYIQILLYASFGLVQALQSVYPHKRRAAEVAYISLSLSAKFLLGVILAAYVLM
jgi:hypothetical protein